jgi:predicted transcriptional regulator
MTEKEMEKVPEPTRAELEILQVLWQYGPSTVRTVNDVLKDKRAVQYTSTLRLMQLMVEKNLLKRDESAMKHIYMPVEEEQKTKKYLLDRFVNSMYNGSISKLMLQLLGSKDNSEEELAEIKEMIAKIEKEKD